MAAEDVVQPLRLFLLSDQGSLSQPVPSMVRGEASPALPVILSNLRLPPNNIKDEDSEDAERARVENPIVKLDY